MNGAPDWTWGDLAAFKRAAIERATGRRALESDQDLINGDGLGARRHIPMPPRVAYRVGRSQRVFREEATVRDIVDVEQLPHTDLDDLR